MGHNGGRSQVNTASIQSSGDFPFLNLLKCSQAWLYINAVTPTTPLAELDSDGYPTSILGGTGGVYTVFQHPSLTDRPGNYVVKWQGTGTVQVSHAKTIVSGSLSGSNGRCVITPTSIDGSGLRITATTVGDHLHDLVYCHVDDEALLDAGQYFGVKFLERLREANYGVMRHLGWQGGFNGANDSNISQWSHRKPLTYFKYGGGEFRASIYGGQTTNSGNDYSLAYGGYALTDKATFQLLFGANAPRNANATVTISQASPAVFTLVGHGMTANNSFHLSTTGALPSPVAIATRYYVKTVLDTDTFTASTSLGGAAIDTTTVGSGTHTLRPLLTLDVNGTGPKLMVAPNAVSIGSPDPLFSQFSSQYPLAGLYATMIYDATIDRYYKFGGDLDRGNSNLNNGCPPEIALQLAIEIGAHPWFVTPFLAAEGSSDYMSSLAAMVKARQDTDASWMIPRYEPPNETWNFSAPFLGTFYARAVSGVLWGAANDIHNAYGRWASVLGGLISTVYEGDSSRYQVICAVQTAGSTAAQNARLDATLYHANNGGEHAYNRVTHMAMANYFNATLTDTQELQMAYDFDNAGSSAEEDALAAQYIESTSVNADFGVPKVAGFATAWKAWAVAFNPALRMTFYEGLYSADLQTADSTATITGVTNAATCVITVSSGAANRLPPVGSTMSIASVGGATGINGQTVTVTAVNAGTRQITTSFDSTSAGTYTSGGTATYVNSKNMRNALRSASKAMPRLEFFTRQLMTLCVTRGGEFPSTFVMSSNAPASNIWTKFDPDIYGTALPEWDALVKFNNNATPLQFTLTVTG